MTEHPQRIAVITGASSGIGAATARALSRGGFLAVLGARRLDRLEQVAAESGGVALALDVADKDSIERFAADVGERFGRIDVLVNNAAIFEENPFFESSYDKWREGWERTFAINVFGTANLTYLVLQRMREQGHGKIINIVSRSTHRGELTFADYAASKAAINNLTKSIARSCAKDGITAIAIAPGFSETAMASDELQRRTTEIVAEIPLGRIGTPEAVAGVVTTFAREAGE